MLLWMFIQIVLGPVCVFLSSPVFILTYMRWQNSHVCLCVSLHVSVCGWLMEKVRVRAQWGCGWWLLTKSLWTLPNTPGCCFFFFLSVSHLVTELPPSQRWSWEEAPSRLLVSTKASNSGQQSTPCNKHHKHFFAKNGKTESTTKSIKLQQSMTLCRMSKTSDLASFEEFVLRVCKF